MDGRTTEPAYTISSPGAFGSGELKKLFIRFTVHIFRERLSICKCASYPLGFEGGMWDLIVFNPDHPDHCLSLLIFICVPVLVYYCKFFLLFISMGVLDSHFLFAFLFSGL